MEGFILYDVNCVLLIFYKIVIFNLVGVVCDFIKYCINMYYDINLSVNDLSNMSCIFHNFI